MIPGLTSKISERNQVALATTVIADADLLIVQNTSTTTVLTTLAPRFGGGFSGVTFIHNSSGAAITTVTTGNILTAVTIPDNALVVLTYSKALGKYIVGSTT